MAQQYFSLIENNKKWATNKHKADPEYFKKLSLGQQPNFLYIGCSDSRMPLDTFTQTEPGELFVHRNIANQVSITDINFLSVLDYAVNVLKVKHIIVCGHYNCGGVTAAYKGLAAGLVGNWISPVRDLAKSHQEELDQIEDETLRINRLTELNVLQQVQNLCKTHVVQQAVANGNTNFQVHGWVLDLSSGLIKELEVQKP
jgi:carbonic anhydrase